MKHIKNDAAADSTPGGGNNGQDGRRYAVCRGSGEVVEWVYEAPMWCCTYDGRCRTPVWPPSTR